MAEHRPEIIELIENYKGLPCLWDSSLECYKDKKQKAEAWKILVAKYKKTQQDADVAYVKKTIETMKEIYDSEVKMVRDSKKYAGSSTSEVQKQNLWFYELMSFLDKTNKQQKSEIDSLASDDDSEQSSRSELQEKRTLKRKNQNRAETAQKLLKPIKMPWKEENSSETAEKLPTQNPKKSNTFALYIGEQLECISTNQRHIAEKLISDVIFLAKTDHLNFQSKIKTPLPPFNDFDVVSPSFSGMAYNPLSPSDVTNYPTSPAFSPLPSEYPSQPSSPQSKKEKSYHTATSDPPLIPPIPLPPPFQSAPLPHFLSRVIQEYEEMKREQPEDEVRKTLRDLLDLKKDNET